ncbi:MAG: hypothetical protein FWJ66_01985 [Caldibacillus sp.]
MIVKRACLNSRLLISTFLCGPAFCQEIGEHLRLTIIGKTPLRFPSLAVNPSVVWEPAKSPTGSSMSTGGPYIYKVRNQS